MKRAKKSLKVFPLDIVDKEDRMDNILNSINPSATEIWNRYQQALIEIKIRALSKANKICKEDVDNEKAIALSNTKSQILI